MAYTEAQLVKFTDPLSATEDQRALNSLDMVKDAVDKYEWESYGIIRPEAVDVKGSYKANTNVNADSDIDMYVLHAYHYMINDNLEISADHTGAGKPASDLREHLFKALKVKFGDDVIDDNKCFKLRENSYKLKADIVSGVGTYFENNKGRKGISLFSKDKPGIIVNFPVQDYENGAEKNKRTNHYYKYIVRILKNIRNELELSTPSFLIECLAYNAPDAYFLNTIHVSTYSKKLKNYIIPDLLRKLQNTPNEFVEINNVKTLFFNKQKWTTADAILFLKAVDGTLEVNGI